MGVDLSSLKQTKESLLESETNFQALAEAAPDAIITIDDESSILFVNAAAERIFGYRVDEMVGAPLTMLMPDNLRPLYELSLRRYLESGRRHIARDGVEFVGLHRNGRELSLVISFSEFTKDGNRYFTGIARDITGRIQVEEALRKSEAKFRAIYERANIGIGLANMEGICIQSNPALQEMLGYSEEELRSMSIEDFTHPDDVSVSMALFKQSIEGKRDAYQIEKRYIRKDGQVIWCKLISSHIPGDADEPPYNLGMMENITERKKSEKNLRESEERYRELVENANDIIYVHDLEGRFISINKAGERITGYSPKEARGLSIADVIAPEYMEQARQRIAEKVMGGALANYELEIVAKDGSRISLEINSRPLIQNGVITGIQGIARDITERKRAEKERTHLLRRLATAQEGERHRIAGELHDQMGQYLAALMLGIKSLKDASQSVPHLNRSVMKLQEIVTEFSQEVRSLVLELRPMALDDLGLSAALSSYLEQWLERSGIAVDFHSNGLINKRFHPHIEITVYRVIQEALNNVLKHSGARHVSLVMEYRQGRLLTVLDDDGRGFNLEAALNSPVAERGLGLTGMRERVESVSGTLVIESSPGMGTTLVARIPVVTPEGIESD